MDRTRSNPSTDQAATRPLGGSRPEESPERPRALPIRLASGGLRLVADLSCTLGLLALFYLLFTPVAMWRGMTRSDPLKLKFDPKAETYLIRKPAGEQPDAILQDSARGITGKIAKSLGPRKRLLIPILGLLSWLARKRQRRAAEQPMTVYTMF